MTTMPTTTPDYVELDQRSASGLTVWLLWDPVSGQTFIGLNDNGTVDTFPVAADRAGDAFTHPYAYKP